MFTGYLQMSGAYAIPPILGFLVLICLTLISIIRSGKNPRNTLFAGICHTVSLVNADMVLVSTIPDKILALTIDRILHFSLSLPCASIYNSFIRSSVFLDGDGLCPPPFW